MRLDLPTEFVQKVILRALRESGQVPKGEDAHVEYVLQRHPLMPQQIEVVGLRIRTGKDHPKARALLNPYG